MSKKNNKNQAVAFLYGINGGLVRSKNVVMFTVESCEPTDVVAYVQKKFLEHYTDDIAGRYIKCSDAAATLQTILENAKKESYVVKGNIIRANVNNASALLRSAVGSGDVHNFALQPKTEKTKVAEGKTKVAEKTVAHKETKKKKEESESDDDDKKSEKPDEESEDDVSVHSDNDDDDSDDNKKKPKKVIAKKPAKAPPKSEAKKKK